jgi:uncharacterized hydrophobic protein (TIGR00271 family)
MGIRQRFRQYVHPPSIEERKVIIDEITESASSGFVFFLLVVLSCSIATMGSITDSPAMIIGAMLVAPLMSPIIGLGLASIIGSAQLAESALAALVRGAALAILLSALMTILNHNLPFVVLQELPAEVLSRTHPSPIDLVVALAGGVAAAYAMTRPKISAALPGVAIATALMPPLCTIGFGLALRRLDVAAGAGLLFITNAITIAFAAAVVFFPQGFVSERPFQRQIIARTLLSSASRFHFTASSFSMKQQKIVRSTTWSLRKFRVWVVQNSWYWMSSIISTAWKWSLLCVQIRRFAMSRSRICRRPSLPACKNLWR